MLGKKFLALIGSAALVAMPVVAQAQSAEEETGATGIGSEGVILGVLALGAVGLGVWAAVDGESDDAPVSP